MRRDRSVLSLLFVGALMIASAVLHRSDAQTSREFREPFPTPAELGEATPPLVTPAWLAERLDDPEVAILDARHSGTAYVEEHIPGAQQLSCENLRSTAGGVPGMIVPVDALEMIIGRLGLLQYTHVVVYSDESDHHATFVATVLKVAGMQRVSVLDGGLKRWTAEELPLTSERSLIKETKVCFTPNLKEIADLAGVLQAVENGSALLIDAREVERFEAGHLPGAVNRFWKTDLVPDDQEGGGSFRAIEELEEEYRALGVRPDRPVIVYCTSGHSATAVYYNLRHRLGLPNVKFYDGSWLEWSMHPDLRREPAPETRGNRKVPPKALARARTAARALVGDLMSRLLLEMRKGGPVLALGVCYEIAPSIAAKHSRDGLTVRRVSSRARNSADTPDEYERVVLRDLQWRLQHGTLPQEFAEVVTEEGRSKLRYLRPILIQEVCLACHGDPEQIDPEVREFLKERYPADRAIGYKIGDLRGAASVIVDLE